MRINTLQIIGKLMYLTGAVILALSAVALTMSPILILLAGQMIIIVPIVGVILFIAGKRIGKRFTPTVLPAERPVYDHHESARHDNPIIETSAPYDSTVATLTSAKSAGSSVISNTADGARKSKRIKTLIVVGAIIAVMLLLNFASLHRLNTYRKLNNVELPLSNKGASISTNGIAANSTAITFTVNKSYANSFEAKEDIIKKLDEAGISILAASHEPDTISLSKGTTAEGNNIQISFHRIEMSFPSEYHIFAFNLEAPVKCTYGTQSNSSKTDSQCEGKLWNDSLKRDLANSRPISSVDVFATVYY